MGYFDRFDIYVDGKYHVPDPVIVDIAEQICELYLRLKPTYTNRRASISKRELPRFYEAGRLCHASRLTPEQYVTQQLSQMAGTGNMWGSAIATKVGHELTHDREWVDAVHYYKAQLAKFQSLSTIYGPRLVLEDVALDLSPLFRAYESHAHGFADLLVRFREAALLEYRSVIGAECIFDALLPVLQDGS